jgi:hypothetical protein
MLIEIAEALEDLQQARIQFEEALAAFIAQDMDPGPAAARGEVHIAD